MASAIYLSAKRAIIKALFTQFCEQFCAERPGLLPQVIADLKAMQEGDLWHGDHDSPSAERSALLATKLPDLPPRQRPLK